MNFTSSPFERMMKEVPHPGWEILKVLDFAGREKDVEYTI